jgi:hypothetical protein
MRNEVGCYIYENKRLQDAAATEGTNEMDLK